MKNDSPQNSLPQRPERRDTIEAIPVHDDLVLYDGVTKNGISLNETARKVWEMADGSRTVLDIVNDFADGLGLSDRETVAELEKDVRMTLSAFQKNKLLK